MPSASVPWTQMHTVKMVCLPDGGVRLLQTVEIQIAKSEGIIVDNVAAVTPRLWLVRALS
jgi:hypothetical protein